MGSNDDRPWRHGTPALAGELVVNVAGIASAAGEVGCALHDNPAQFPTGHGSTPAQWQKADSSGIVCRFKNLPAGSYAVAVSQDFNGNRKTDTNFVGMPTEPWGVSNNVRPTLRAPTFDEAKVLVPASGSKTIVVRLSR